MTFKRDARLPAPYPLYWPDDWARTRYRVQSKYKVDFIVARTEVADQLRLLTGNRNFSTSGLFVVSTDVPLRLDGLPLANQREPNDPGVAVWWLEKDQLRVIACDRWRTVRENLRAVGLAVEALRAFQRCGATQILERAMAAFDRPQLSVPRPWWFGELGLTVWPPTVDQVDRAWRARVQVTHPDKGGTGEAFNRTQQAREEATSFARRTA